MKKTNFRKQIHKLIKMKKVSISTVAHKAGMNHSTLYNYLAESSEMTSANLEKLFDILNKMKG